MKMAAIAQKELFKKELRAVGVRTYLDLDGKSYIRKEDLEYAIAVGELIEGGFKDKLKSMTKSFLKKGIAALLGLGIFAGTAAASPEGLKNAQKAAEKFDTKIETIAQDEGLNIDVETTFKETKTTVFQYVTLTNLDDGDTIKFKITKVKDGSYETVHRDNSKGSDNEFDYVFEEFGDLFGDNFKMNVGN